MGKAKKEERENKGMQRMEPGDFIEIGVDTYLEGKVPEICFECSMLRVPNTLHREWYCNFVFLADKYGYEAKCENGQILYSESKHECCKLMDIICMV